MANYKKYLKDWERASFKVNDTLLVNPINQSDYQQAFAQMEVKAQQVKFAYDAHFKALKERHEILEIINI